MQDEVKNSSEINSTQAPIKPLSGGELVFAALALSCANFIAVLDMTIANVSVPNIAGGLGVSGSEGTYVITSYAVAEAITVPLTGFIANRFGTVRSFVVSMMMFGIFSALCGLSNSLGMLVVARILQGIAGGPLMPLSQALLFQIFPPEKRGAAIALWSMTTLIAPIMGPILGGVLCDWYSWPIIFLINVPVAIICSYFAWKLLRRHETSIKKVRIDIIGFILLIIWVGSLQLMLDEGKNHDWFESSFIISLAIVAFLGFVIFLIWELNIDDPIVNLRIFANRGYTIGVFTLSLAFASFFAVTVLAPLWLQLYMGYNSTWAGYVMALTGVLAVLVAPIAATMSMKIDGRPLVFFGILWLAAITYYRSFLNTDMTYWQIATPLLLQGIGMPFFFVPLTGLALASVNPKDTAAAAGLMSFLRTVSGAFAVSIVTTAWENKASFYRSEMVGSIDKDGAAMNLLLNSGMTNEQSLAIIDRMAQEQSVVLATNYIFFISALFFVFAAFAIWLAPKTSSKFDMNAAH